ncbi:hypothetical protein B0187_04195 [Haemophilus paracuniculus]|uniref:Threonine export protein RhtC n=1 Tax=Haemophilus paracuniculus TaxID=734 RepID=A0A1T0AUK7_9PAST|nr:LysE family transporter [Haemophilus paracuniculus]OOS00151.1 hypothetical protein B0187_04195 [Haemophilus paracuniculus]
MLTILFVNLMGLLSPGPDFFYVSRKAASSTTRNAIFGSVGIGLGVCFWAAMAIFGLTFINKNLPFVQGIIICLGGSYLAYSGWKMVQIRKNVQLKSDKIQENQDQPIFKSILEGLMINLSNAKVVVFFSSVFSGYAAAIGGYSDSLLAIFLIGAESMLYFIVIALLFSRQPVRAFYAKHSRYMDNLAGIVFIFFGLSLIYNGVSQLMAG